MVDHDNVAAAAKQTLRDSSRILVFDEKETVLFSNFEVKGLGVSHSCSAGHRACAENTDCYQEVFSSTFQLASLQANQAELAPLMHTLDDRDSAIRSGLNVHGKRYEV